MGPAGTQLLGVGLSHYGLGSHARTGAGLNGDYHAGSEVSGIASDCRGMVL